MTLQQRIEEIIAILTDISEPLLIEYTKTNKDKPNQPFISLYNTKIEVIKNAQIGDWQLRIRQGKRNNYRLYFNKEWSRPVKSYDWEKYDNRVNLLEDFTFILKQIAEDDLVLTKLLESKDITFNNYLKLSGGGRQKPQKLYKNALFYQWQNKPDYFTNLDIEMLNYLKLPSI